MKYYLLFIVLFVGCNHAPILNDCKDVTNYELCIDDCTPSFTTRGMYKCVDICMESRMKYES